MTWTNLTAAADRQSIAELERWFWDRGAVSVTVADGGSDPIYEPGPGEQPLWGKALVTGLFANDAEDQQAIFLGEGLEAAGFELVASEELADRPWEREWMHRFKPMQFGQRLWVCPTGYELDTTDRVVISLDPGLAFGSGTHETTHLCLEYLDGASLEQAAVIDYGCGSGILAVAAALLGASPVYATDTDPQAIAATEMNAARNGVDINAGLVDDLRLAPAHLVMANILAQPLARLADRLSSLVRPGGELVLSGIMVDQADWVKQAYRNLLAPVAEAELDGWMRLVFRKPQ